MKVPLQFTHIGSSYPLFPSKIVKNENISKKDLLSKKMEMRFVILAHPEYTEACLMIAKRFVRSDLQNDHCAPVARDKSHPAFKFLQWSLMSSYGVHKLYSVYASDVILRQSYFTALLSFP